MTDKSVKDYLAALESSAKGEQKNAAKILQKARVELFEANKEPNFLLAPQEGNTFFEQLTCVGYYPPENRLEAVVQIKRRFGYAGEIPICCTHVPGVAAVPGTRGSFEYVAFYVNWNNDGDFSDQLIGENVGSGYVNVFDGPYAPPLPNPTHPISYAVYRDIIPSATLVTGTLVRVRAILSWGVMPNGPGFVPVWGNVLDTTIRIQ
ncbi:MAG: hypothetical protein ACKVT2_16260 [Saprospiraceae bacterium]